MYANWVWGDGDDKIMGEQNHGTGNLAEICVPMWSALDMDQLSDGGGSVPSRPLQSALVLSGCRP